MSNGNDRDTFSQNDDASDGNNSDGGSLSGGRPAVAAAPGKMMMVLGAALIFLIVVIKSLFFSSEKHDDKPAPRPKEQVSEVSKNPNELPVGILPTTPVPDTSTTSLPPPPPVSLPSPPPLPAPPSIPELRTRKAPDDQALLMRIKSPMVVSGGGLSASMANKGQGKTAPPISNDPNLAFAQAVGASEGAGRVVATNIGNLNYTIAQGKFIHAVMESAINSDLPSPLRAIVSHDIYGEAGKNILIPKGSRLIGVYNSTVRRGQARVYIIWTRVIRPDGIDVAIDSPGVDTLGRGGQGGDVDNKYFEMFSTAILTSSLDVGIAAVGQGLFGNQQQTTTSGPNGGTTTTSSPTSTAMQQAVQNVGTMGQSILGNVLNLQPTIHVDQGVTVDVFVNHDLVFPPRIIHKSSFIE